MIPDPNCAAGLDFLQDYFRTRSYVSGFSASQDDSALFRAFRRGEPQLSHDNDSHDSNDSHGSYDNVVRWYRHLKALDRKELPEGKGIQVLLVPAEHEEVFLAASPG